MNNASTDRASKIVHVLPWVSAVLLVAVLAVTLTSAFQQFQTNAGVNATNRSDRVTACRAAYRADIDSAASARADAESTRFDAISDLILAGRTDTESRDAAISRLAAAKAEVATARAEVATANDAYREAVKLSGTDAAKFLASARCREG